MGATIFLRRRLGHALPHVADGANRPPGSTDTTTGDTSRFSMPRPCGIAGSCLRAGPHRAPTTRGRKTAARCRGNDPSRFRPSAARTVHSPAATGLKSGLKRHTKCVRPLRGVAMTQLTARQSAGPFPCRWRVRHRTEDLWATASACMLSVFFPKPASQNSKTIVIRFVMVHEGKQSNNTMGNSQGTELKDPTVKFDGLVYRIRCCQENVEHDDDILKARSLPTAAAVFQGWKRSVMGH